MFYRGEGATFSPYVPAVDEALGRGLKRLGFKGARRKGESVFAAVEMDQARKYLDEEERGRLYAVEPLPGATVTWVEGTKDLVLDFGAWLRHASSYHAFPRRVVDFLNDVQGDVHVFDIYVQLKRQRTAVDMVVDAFLSELKIQEVEIIDGAGLSIEGHDGEVWITGPCRIEEIAPEPVMVP